MNLNTKTTDLGLPQVLSSLILSMLLAVTLMLFIAGFVVRDPIEGMASGIFMVLYWVAAFFIGLIIKNTLQTWLYLGGACLVLGIPTLINLLMVTN